MRGGMYFFPLYVDPQEAMEADTPERVHSLPTHDAVIPNDFDPHQLGAILSAVETPLLEMQDSVVMDEATLDEFPSWAQSVIRTGCFGAQSLTEKKTAVSPHPHQSPLVESKHKRFYKDDRELTPTKRRRSLYNGHSRVVLNEGDEQSRSSQDEKFDTCPPRTFFITQEQRVAESVEKYSDMLEQIIDNANQRQQIDVDQQDGVDLFSGADVKTLLQSLKMMKKGEFIRRVDPELLIALASLIDTQAMHFANFIYIRRGLELDPLATMHPENGDERLQAFGIDTRLISRVLLSLDVGICQLLIMSTSDIDRRVLSEDSIDNYIQLLHHVIHRLVLPCIDTTAATTLASPSAVKDSSGQQIEGVSRSPASKSRSGRGSRASSLNFRTNKSIRKAIDRVIPVVCEFMNHLATLIHAVKLDDRWILHLSSSMMELFKLEHTSYATSLQQNGLQVLRALFLRYKVHRPMFMEEILGTMMKLPTSKRNLRTVKLLESNECIQMIATLVVSMVQACASTQDNPDSLPGDLMSAESTLNPTEIQDETNHNNKISMSALDDTRESAKLFVRPLVKECLKKHEERDNRVILENFVEDLLVMFVRPEWAGAEILLEVLTSSLASILNASATTSKDSKKLDAHYSLTALNLVGKICSSIKRYQNMAARDPVDDAGDARTILEEHKQFLEGSVLGGKRDGTDMDGPQLDRYLILKHVIMVYMRRNGRLGTSWTDSQRLLLLRFIHESTSCSDAVKDTNNPEVSLWNSFWDTSDGSIDAISKVPSPSNDLCLRFSLHVVVTREFCSLFDKLLIHVMALLSQGLPTFRARVLKVIGGIVDVDPMIMAERGVREAVRQCFLDGGTSVRQAAVDLVGKYVTLQPLLFDRYFDILVERLRDKGISVRKSVCKIFRNFLTLSTLQGSGEDGLLSAEELQRKSVCMRSMVERIGDPSEEQVVKDFIIDTFQEVWFGSELSSRSSSTGEFADEKSMYHLPPGWSAVETAPKVTEFISPDGQKYGSLEEAWSAYRTSSITPSSVVKSKQSKYDDTPDVVSTIVEVIHDITNLDWFVSLLKRLLQDESSNKTGKNGGRLTKDRSEEIKVATLRSEKITACLIEILLQLQEGKSLKGVTIGDLQLQFLSCLKTLSAFCEARPQLLSISHVEHSIMLYLKGDENLSKANEAKVQTLAVCIINNVLENSVRIVERIATRLEDDLKNLILRAPPSVVSPSVKCLVTLSKTTRKPPTLLFKLLDMFYAYLQKYKDLESPMSIPSDANSSLQRALYVAGSIAGAMDLDAYEIPENEMANLCSGSIMDSLYCTYTKYLKFRRNISIAAKAVQGLGFLFPIRPRLLLRAQQDGILDFLLTESPNEMRLQCLTSLKELLSFEEQRLEREYVVKNMSKVKTKTEQVQGDQEADASLIGSVMQAQLEHILELSFHKWVRIRTEAVSCLGTLLTQGLVSPRKCIPNLVALETDQIVPIRDLAHAQLLALHEKFPTELSTPAIQGITLAHSFQMSVFGNWTVFAFDKEKKEYCLYGRLYMNCIRSGRQSRNLFLAALINQFIDTGNILSSANITAKALQTIDYLCYLSQVLAALPYDIEDEPLYIIYLINRKVTLKLGMVLDKLKQAFTQAGVDPTIMDEDDTDLADINIKEHFSGHRLSHDQKTCLHTTCVIAFSIGMLIRLKFFLKDMYLLDNEKCQTYQPGNASKATDESVVLSEKSFRLNLPPLEDFQVADPLERSWNLFLHMWRAARDDQHELDFDAQEDPSRSKKKKGRRRRSIVKHQQVIEEDDDEYVEGFAG